LKDFLVFFVLEDLFFEDYICVHNGDVDFAQLVKRSTCSSRWIRFVFFFFFALWCWAIMRLQHQLTPTAVRHLRHLLLLGFELRQASSLKHGRAIHQQQVADSGEVCFS
jgi:hypothetical protein